MEDKVKEISVNFSKKIGRVGTFGSDMLSASATVSVGSDPKSAYKVAWKLVFEEISEQEKNLKETIDMEDSVSSTITNPVDIENNVVCPVHKVKMEHFVKPDGDWWSHKVGDKWCNGRDTKYNKDL